MPTARQLQAAKGKPFRPRLYDFTYETLHDLRIVQNLSLPRIAQLYGCADHTAVANACARLGIPTKRALKRPPIVKRAARKTREADEPYKQILPWPDNIRFHDANIPRGA